MTSTTDLPTGNGELILVVDDEESLRELVKNTLESFGYRVISAGNGREGMEKYRNSKEKIAVILTDASVPEMHGPSMITTIRSVDKNIRVILASGFGHPTRMAEADASLQKSCTTERLLKTLNDVLSN